MPSGLSRSAPNGFAIAAFYNGAFPRGMREPSSHQPAKAWMPGCRSCVSARLHLARDSRTLEPSSPRWSDYRNYISQRLHLARDSRTPKPSSPRRSDYRNCISQRLHLARDSQTPKPSSPRRRGSRAPSRRIFPHELPSRRIAIRTQPRPQVPSSSQARHPANAGIQCLTVNNPLPSPSPIHPRM